jgi:hypothetical protein
MKRNQAVGAMIVILVLVFTCWPIALAAQAPLQNTPPEAPELPTQLSGALVALGRLSLAALLASVLALRPRRLGTPNRRPEVIHTQIILAVVGSLVMLVVGTSLARAFGIVGAAGLVRYRAKVEDPKDAGVMLSTLAIGLATGVGQWVLAIEGTVFLLTLLWTIESFAPTATTLFDVKIKGSDVAALKERIEALLNRHKARFAVRATSQEEIVYEVRWPIDRPSGRLSERIAAIDPSRKIEVVIEQKKEK